MSSWRSCDGQSTAERWVRPVGQIPGAVGNRDVAPMIDCLTDPCSERPGISNEFPINCYFRDAKVLRIVEGTNQIQRNIIARNVIGEAPD